MIAIRSFLFNLVFILSIIVFASLLLLTFPVPFRWRYTLIRVWSALNLFLLRVICGLKYRVSGYDNIPKGPVVILSNHQSTWETITFQYIFPPLAWVLKRELMWIPLFGWALALLKPIAIDRGAGRRAVDQIIEQGSKRLQVGRCVMVFPQGTRVAHGQKRRYGIGGAVLAVESGYPVLPVAHNAGRYWPRRGFLKYPGTIEVRIGPVIETRGQKAETVIQATQTWIESQHQSTEDN